jgi:chromosomal replication initiation ATPase DnaA
MAFGDRDHSTVIHGANKIARLLPYDRVVSSDIAHVEAML